MNCLNNQKNPFTDGWNEIKPNENNILNKEYITKKELEFLKNNQYINLENNKNGEKELHKNKEIKNDGIINKLNISFLDKVIYKIKIQK